MPSNFDSTSHPRHSAGAPASQGGEFRPKGTGGGIPLVADTLAPMAQEFDKADSQLPADPTQTGAWRKSASAQIRGLARDAYFREVAPGGAIDSDYQSRIALQVARANDLSALARRAESNPAELAGVERMYGLTGDTPAENLKSLRSKIRAARSSVVVMEKQVADLRRMSEAHEMGTQYVLGGDQRAPDERVTGRADVHERYRKGDVSIEEMSSNPDFRMTVAKDTGEGEVRKFIGAPDYVGEDPAKLRQLRDKLVDMALTGSDGKFWYEISSELIKTMARGDLEVADKLAQLVAIYSGNTPLDTNMEAAKRAWDTYSEAVAKGEYRPITAGVLGTMDRLAEMVLYGGIDWSGRKTNNFYVNLMKRIDPTIEQGVTVDVWAKRPFGYEVKDDGSKGREVKNPSDAQYGFIENMYHQVARELQNRTGAAWSAEQAQAAVWTGARAEDEDGNLKSAAASKEKARRSLQKASASAPRFTRLLQPGELDRRLQGAANQFYGVLKTIGDKADEDFRRGLIDDGEYARINAQIKQVGAGYEDDDDPGEKGPAEAFGKDGFGATLAHARDAYTHAIASTLAEFDLARRWERDKAQSAFDDQRIATSQGEMEKPAGYNFLDAAQKVMAGQVNVEMIPGSGSGWSIGGIASAPYEVKREFSKALYPVVGDVLAHLGVLRGPLADVEGFGDWAGEINPVFGISVATPRAPGGGTPNPSARSDNASAAIHGPTERQLRLASATLAYVLRQHGVAYMNFKPLDDHRQVTFGIGDPKVAEMYGRTPPKPGEKISVADPNADQVDRANVAQFTFAEGTMPMDAWSKLLTARNEAAERYGFDPGAMPIVPTRGGEGFAMLNLYFGPPTDEAGLESQEWDTRRKLQTPQGSGYSNREFQKIASEIVQAVDDPDDRWAVRKRLYANAGSMDYESWEDGPREKAGENLRRIIRDLGGDSAVEYADSVFESRVRPVFEQWENWRERGHGDRPAAYGFERIAASEAAGRLRTGGDHLGTRRAGSRRPPLSLSEREAAWSLVRKVKARRLLLGEHASAPLSRAESATVALLRSRRSA